MRKLRIKFSISELFGIKVSENSVIEKEFLAEESEENYQKILDLPMKIDWEFIDQTEKEIKEIEELRKRDEQKSMMIKICQLFRSNSDLFDPNELRDILALAIECTKETYEFKLEVFEKIFEDWKSSGKPEIDSSPLPEDLVKQILWRVVKNKEENISLEDFLVRLEIININKETYSTVFELLTKMYGTEN